MNKKITLVTLLTLVLLSCGNLFAQGKFEVKFAPEGIPVAQITATGGMHSRCYFSIERGIPLKVEITGQDLLFVLSTDEESEEREPDLHLVFEYQYED